TRFGARTRGGWLVARAHSVTVEHREQEAGAAVACVASANGQLKGGGVVGAHPQPVAQHESAGCTGVIQVVRTRLPEQGRGLIPMLLERQRFGPGHTLSRRATVCWLG